MHASRFLRASLLASTGLLAAAVVVLGGLSVARKVESFQPLGFEARAEGAAGAAWRVTAVDHPGTGLSPGDQILLVDGRQAAGQGDLARELRAEGASELVVLRGGEVAPVSYRRPPLDVDYPYLILALIGVAYLLIGLYTLFRDRRRRAWLFCLWCLASAALYLLTPSGLALLPAPADATFKALFLGDELARVLLPPLTLHLFLVFPSLLGERLRLRRFIPFLYLPAAALLTVQADLAFFGGRFLAGGARAALAFADRLEALHFAAFALAAVAVLVVRLARHRDWEQARQVRWIAVGMAGGYLPFAGLYLLPASLGLAWPEAVNAGAVVPLALVPLTFSYAILRYKLWDIEVIVRDTISYTLTLLLGIIGFSLIKLAIDRGLPQDLAGTRVLLSFVGGAVIAGLLVPARRGIAGGLERIQYRGTYDKRRALADFARDLLHERDLGRLAARLLERLEDTVGVARANLYLAAAGGDLEPARREPELPAPLAFDALGGELWGREFRRLAATAPPGGPAPVAQRLFAAGYRYAFPLSVRGQGVGLALTGYKADQVPLNSDDVELIRQLLDQAALAIENAQLLDRVQQQLEEVHRLQQYSEGIIESSPAGIAVIDEDGRIRTANAAFAELAGVDHERLRGAPIAALLPVGPLPEPGGKLLEASYRDAGGRERHLQLSTAGFHRASGERLRIVVVHDVSERVAMEEALKQKDRLAALGVLAAGVAHEVNTPITGISSYAQMLLADTPEGDPRRALLQKVERQTFRAARIVNSLLEFARNRDGELAPVELAAMVDECLDLVRDHVARRGVRVDWRAPAAAGGESGGVTVMGIEGELQQVITNLLLNGCDAMAEGGGVLTLRLAAQGGRALLTVEDTGTGISAEHRAKIFEPFFTTKRGAGTGLGLAISYEIVRRHGGELAVESEPGRGSRFTVDLPLAGSAPVADAPPAGA
jgi:PAS domain S-box-containing protein